MSDESKISLQSLLSVQNVQQTAGDLQMQYNSVSTADLDVIRQVLDKIKQQLMA